MAIAILYSYSLTSMSFTSLSNSFACLTELPMAPEFFPRTGEKIFIAEGYLNGIAKTKFAADSWDLKLSPQDKPTFMLRCMNGQWIELGNPAQDYLKTMKSALVAAYLLNVMKQRPTAPMRDVWPYVRAACRGVNMEADLADLEESAALIKSIVWVDPILQQSPILGEIYGGLGDENIQQEVSEEHHHRKRNVNEEVPHVPEALRPRVVHQPHSAPLTPPEREPEHQLLGLHLPGYFGPQGLDKYRGDHPSQAHLEAEWPSVLGSHFEAEKKFASKATQGHGSSTSSLASEWPLMKARYFARKTSQGLAPQDPKLSSINEVNRTPIDPVVPPRDSGLSSPNDANRTPIASRPQEPGLSNVSEVHQNPNAPLIRSEEPGLSDINDVYRTPTAPVIPSESEPNRAEKVEGFKGRVYSQRPIGNGLPDLDVAREGTVAEGASSGLHRTHDSGIQALDTPVEVSRIEHLASAAAPGEKGKGIAGEGSAREGNAAEYTEDVIANWVDEPDVCAFCEDGVNGDHDLLCCDYCMRSFHPTPASGLHTNCQSLCLSQAVSEIKDWLCPNCEAKQHQCFACGELGLSDPTTLLQTVFECNATKCKRFYHPHCVVTLLYSPEAQDAEAERIQQKQNTFTCPLHRCEKCNKPRKTGLVKCRRCPRAWHKKCLPEGSQNRMWKFAHKHVMYCDKHNIDKDLRTPLRNHIVFPKPPMVGEKRGRGTPEPSGSTEPASENPSAATQPRVEGLMENTSEATRLEKLKKLKGKELAYPSPTSPQNVEDISDPIPLEPVEKKPRLHTPQPESEASEQEMIRPTEKKSNPIRKTRSF